MLRTILLLGLVFLVLWGVLYVAQAPRLTGNSLAKENISPVPDSAALSKLRYLEEPIAQKTDSLIVLYQYAFTVGYSHKYQQALWVAYQFTRNELEKVARRAHSFKPDPRLPQATVSNKDYAHSHYDRGHLAPAGDMRWNKQAMSESFYFSNISPQDKAFNRGIWRSLEQQVRDWVTRFDTLYVVTGPLFLKECGFLGKSQIPVPSHFYKALLTYQQRQWEAVAFIFPNEAVALPMDGFRTSVDSLEVLARIDFFPLLADSIEFCVEKQYNDIFWHVNR